MKKMTKSELKSIVNSEIRSSMGYIGGDLSDQRADAMDYYLGEPFGNEQENRSQVVSTDVAETIEWMMPSLMRIFTTSEDAVRFEPTGPEDEDAAQQETDYCNYVFYKKNPGFLIAYTWIKDALLQKVGVVKPYVEKEEEVEREEYEGLSQDEFTLLLNDPDLEPKEHEERIQAYEIDGQVVEEIVHDVVFNRKCSYHKIEIPNVPPEEFLISSKTSSIDPKEAPFVAHRRQVTLSELREEGYSEKILEKLDSDDSERQNEEWWARHNLSDETQYNPDNNPAMKEITVNECYLRVDYDGDGIAELRKVTIAGNEILDNEEVDRIPFCAMTPVILTHKFFGLSIADLIMDLQLIKSMLWRQTFDNLYLLNNQRPVVNYKNVNLDDILNSSPGAPIRTKGIPGQDVMYLQQPQMSQNPIEMMNYIDTVKESRTGVGKQFQGLNADTLKDANIPAVHGLVTAAQQRVEMIARIFAETGFKQLFRDIHELTRKYPNKAEVVRLRGDWVEVDPREWRRRTQMSVTVGLGTASQDAQIMNINQVIGDMKTATEMGGFGQIVSMDNFYKALSRKTKLLGFKSPDEFWMDPEKNPPPPPQPPQEDPLVKAQAIKSQADAQVAQMKEQMKQLAEASKRSIEHQRLMLDAWKAEAGHAENIAKMEIDSKNREADLGDPGIGAELDQITNILNQIIGE